MLGSELHYQAVVYHCLRGHIPSSQLGMNVKMMIHDPQSELFKDLTQKRHPDFRSGFEPIPDVAVFSAHIEGDWRRRNNEATLRHMLVAIEIKASERDNSRLQPGEIEKDVLKLAAHREEARAQGSDFTPIMMIIDTAPVEAERMTAYGLQRVRNAAKEAEVSVFYLSPSDATVDIESGVD